MYTIKYFTATRQNQHTKYASNYTKLQSSHMMMNTAPSHDISLKRAPMHTAAMNASNHIQITVSVESLGLKMKLKKSIALLKLC
jgi:hypothetical protein